MPLAFHKHQNMFIFLIDGTNVNVAFILKGHGGSGVVDIRWLDAAATCPSGRSSRRGRSLSGPPTPALSPRGHPGPDPPRSSHSAPALPHRTAPHGSDTHGPHFSRTHTQRGHGMETEGSQSALSAADSPHDPW